MDDISKVKKFFDRRVAKFDSIYSSQKRLLWRVLDFIFRSSMQRRFELTLEELKEVKGKQILDIGCGTGRYSVALADREALVTGIDFASQMVELAQNFSQEKGAANLCQFIVGDFMDYPFQDKFDISLAIGFFDYIKEPVKYLAKIKGLTRQKVIISFPAKWRLRNIIRRLRLKILGCPVYFYDEGDIQEILRESGFTKFAIKNIGRDYFVVAKA